MRLAPSITIAALSLIAGCSTLPGPGAKEHAAHHPPEAAAAKADQQMNAMQEMHQKMQSAKTPQERAALMDEHMKAMQGGMNMMCDMGGGTGTGSQGRAGSQDMMARCMKMKDMTMQMMMDREAAKAPAGK